MRQTALPLLRDLVAGTLVQRCEFCRSFALGEEVCRSEEERQACVPRRFIERVEAPVVLLAGSAML